MSHEARAQPATELSRSPLWSHLLERAEAQIASARPPAERSATSAGHTVDSAAAHAHSRLLVALDCGTHGGRDLVSELIGGAADVIVDVEGLATWVDRRQLDHRARLVDQLRRHLSAHEDRVLAGEITYNVGAQEGEASAARIRHALAHGTPRKPTSNGDLLSLEIAAVDMASLLVRAAANAASGGRADDAPEYRSTALDRTLRAIARELATRAREVERPVDERGDVVAHHLAAGLRVRVSPEALDGLTSASAREPADPALLRNARAAWLRLATCEYVAIAALDDPLESPAYAEHFGNLPTAIVDGAANVICGARLIGRPSAFRHRAAWGHQGVALSYALEAYVAGLRGDAPSFAQAQLIALTRLVRAVAAIALLDVRGTDGTAGNGSSRR